jgi:hypothetical protein
MEIGKGWKQDSGTGLYLPPYFVRSSQNTSPPPSIGTPVVDPRTFSAFQPQSFLCRIAWPTFITRYRAMVMGCVGSILVKRIFVDRDLHVRELLFSIVFALLISLLLLSFYTVMAHGITHFWRHIITYRTVRRTVR